MFCVVVVVVVVVVAIVVVVAKHTMAAADSIADVAAFLCVLTPSSELRPPHTSLDFARLLEIAETFAKARLLNPDAPYNPNRIRALMQLSRWLSARHIDNEDVYRASGVPYGDAGQVKRVKKMVDKLLAQAQAPPLQLERPAEVRVLDQLVEIGRASCRERV